MNDPRHEHDLELGHAELEGHPAPPVRRRPMSERGFERLVGVYGGVLLGALVVMVALYLKHGIKEARPS